jgi:hypothetical protein
MAGKGTWKLEWYDGCSWILENTFATKAEALRRKARSEAGGCVPYRVRDAAKKAR